jgi:DnaK suppressor protein
MGKRTNQTETEDEATGLTKAQLEQLRRTLEEERGRILGKLREHLSTAIEDDAALTDEMDQATRAESQAYLLRLADKERKLLKEIDAALDRMAAGVYGLCEGTGEPIGFRRLAARPWARHSIAYKEELEREERGTSRS